MGPGCMIELTLLGVSSLFQHIELVTTSVRARLQAYFLWGVGVWGGGGGSLNQGQGSTI